MNGKVLAGRLLARDRRNGAVLRPVGFGLVSGDRSSIYEVHRLRVRRDEFATAAGGCAMQSRY